MANNFKFNEEAQNLTGFVGIIGDSETSCDVLNGKIKDICVEAYKRANKSFDEEGIEIDQKEICRDLATKCTPEELLLIATQAMSQRTGEVAQAMKANPIGQLAAMLEEMKKGLQES